MSFVLILITKYSYNHMIIDSRSFVNRGAVAFLPGDYTYNNCLVGFWRELALSGRMRTASRVQITMPAAATAKAAE